MELVRLILLITLSGIFGAFYLWFAIIFWRVRRSISQVHQLQFQFNRFNGFNFNNLVKPIELLIHNRHDLKVVVDYINQFNVSFQENLAQVVEVLKAISVYDNHYDLKSTKVCIKKIQTVYDDLNKMINFSTNFSINATGYQICCSNVIINFRKIMDQFWLFLHQHILGSYDNNVIKKCVSKISDWAIQLNNQLSKLDEKEFIKLADQLNSELIYLKRIIDNLYSQDLKLKYLRIIHGQIDFYSNNEDNFKKLDYSNTQILEIKNILEDGRIILGKIKSNLYLFQFQTASQLNNFLFNKLVQLKKQISTDANAFSVVSENVRSFNTQIEVFEKNLENISKSLQTIENNFAANKKVIKMVGDIWKKIDEIKMKIYRIRRYKSNAKQHYFERLKEFIFVIDSIVECQNTMELLIKTMIAFMEEFRHNIQEISNLKLLFAQLQVYIGEEKLFLGNQQDTLFHEWKQKIEEKNTMLTEDYGEFSNQIDLFIQQAHDAFRCLMRDVVLQANFKQIAVSCIAFINKYINEHNTIHEKQKKLELLFLEGKYEKIIKKSIKIIHVIKQSAYENDLDLQ